MSLAPPAGLLVGTFDLFHVGHLDALRRAAATAGRLVVALPADDLAERLTGHRPYVPEVERRAIVGALGLVAEVVLVEHDLGPALDRAAGPVMVVAGDTVAELLTADLPVVPLAEARGTASTAVRAALAARSLVTGPAATGESSVA